MRIVVGVERLLPGAGGAERFLAEAMGALARRGHRVTALWIGGRAPGPGERSALGAGVEGRALASAEGRAPAGADGAGYWTTKRRHARRVAAAVAEELDAEPADVVVSQLHAAPEVLATAMARGARSVLLLPSYESLCKHAFLPGSGCVPASGCARCPAALRLPPDERRAMLASRRAHARALVRASALVAPSSTVAGATERWSGRRPEVVAPVTAAQPRVESRRDGPAVALAAGWAAHKGGHRLGAIARALAPRRLRVTDAAIEPGDRVALLAEPNAELIAPAAPAALLAGAAMLVVPAAWPEPFGRVAFEACSAGVPVLASRVGALAEFVPEAGLVDHPDDAAAWRGAAGRLTAAATWEEARRAGGRAAERLLATRPVERLEAVLAG